MRQLMSIPFNTSKSYLIMWVGLELQQQRMEGFLTKVLAIVKFQLQL